MPIEVTEFTGTLFDLQDQRDDRYTLRVRHPAVPPRTFTAILQGVDWEFNRTPCFFAGNRQGGSVYEVLEPNDSVIEGDYEEYIVGGPFETGYTYGRFVEGVCLSTV